MKAVVLAEMLRETLEAKIQYEKKTTYANDIDSNKLGEMLNHLKFMII